tara:strand:- start:426 stop:581 length:156 start_codon:yes stop_codon:yes gene_type:complete
MFVKILLFLGIVISVAINMILARKIRSVTKKLKRSEDRFRDKYVDDGHNAY